MERVQSNLDGPLLEDPGGEGLMSSALHESIMQPLRVALSDIIRKRNA